jgi:hypothetical protein
MKLSGIGEGMDVVGSCPGYVEVSRGRKIRSNPDGIGLGKVEVSLSSVQVTLKFGFSLN